MEYITKNKSLREFLSHYKSHRWPKFIKLLAVLGLHNLYKIGRGAGITENDILGVIAKMISEPEKEAKANQTQHAELANIATTLDNLKSEVTSLEKLMQNKIQNTHDKENMTDKANQNSCANSPSQSSRSDAMDTIDKQLKHVKELSNAYKAKETNSSYRPPVAISYKNADLTSNKKTLNPVIFEKQPKNMQLMEGNTFGNIQLDKSKSNEVSQQEEKSEGTENEMQGQEKEPSEKMQNEDVYHEERESENAHPNARESIQEDTDIDQLREAKYNPHSKQASMMDNVDGLLSSSLVNQFSSEQPKYEVEDSSAKQIFTFKNPPKEQMYEIQNDNYLHGATRNERNERLYRPCASSIKSEEYLASRRSESSNKSSLYKDKQPCTHEEEPNEADRVDSNNVNTFKSVPVYANDAYVRRRTESMPEDETDYGATQKKYYV